MRYLIVAITVAILTFIVARYHYRTVDTIPITEVDSLRDLNDSLRTLISKERLKYDSLMKCIDSSMSRSIVISIRYDSLINNIRYLDADESINFLNEKL